MQAPTGGQPCTQHDGAKNENTQNFWRPADAGLSCSPGGGAKKQPPSSGTWPCPEPGKPPPSCNQPCQPPWPPGGQPSSATPPARLLQPPSSLKNCPPAQRRQPPPSANFSRIPADNPHLQPPPPLTTGPVAWIWLPGSPTAWEKKISRPSHDFGAPDSVC